MKIGDIVYLNSGSKPLTVVAFNESDDTVYVSWIGKNGSMELQTFPKTSLSYTNNTDWASDYI